MKPAGTSAALQLWCAYPEDLLDESVAQACAAALADEERTRAARYRFERHRRQFFATHALARTALSHRHPLPPSAWNFSENPHGKPATEPDCGLRFNLSNCEGLVVCLVAQQAEVGVDAEPTARASDILALAPEVFSPSEREQLEALDPAGRPDRALTLWVLKEAYIKARGLGLSLDLKKFSFVFADQDEIRLELHPSLDDRPECWRFCLFDLAAHRIAVMAENTAPAELELWEARPPLGPPKRLSNIVTTWFPIG